MTDPYTNPVVAFMRGLGSTRPIGPRRLRTRLRVLIGVAVAAAALTSSPAFAVVLSAGAGGLTPWDDDAKGRYSVMGSIGFNPISELTRLALEVEYRNGETKATVESVSVNIPVDTYDIRAVFRLVFVPGSFTPYLGFGAGLKVISIDLGALNLDEKFAPDRSYGISAGIIGLVGFEIPLLGERLAGFVEGRIDYAWEMTDGFDGLFDNDSAGAFTGMAGLRYTF